MAEDKKKILVVDDEVDFLDIMKARLEANGYEVLTTSNGKEVISRIKADKPDAVMLDILMPDINGLVILKQIRELDEKLPVFIVTGFSNEDRFSIANKFNASGFVLKTHDLQNEIKNISEAIDIAKRYKTKK